MKCQCISDILIMCHIFVILCLLAVICISLSIFGKDILITYQNSPKSLFIYLYGFKYLVYYNLVVCYSLGPVFNHLVCQFSYFSIDSTLFF